jgi:hypothetical protein
MAANPTRPRFVEPAEVIDEASESQSMAPVPSVPTVLPSLRSEPPRYDRLFGLMPNQQDVDNINLDHDAARKITRGRFLKKALNAVTREGHYEALQTMAGVEVDSEEFRDYPKTYRRAMRMIETTHDHIEQTHTGIDKQLLRSGLNSLQ